MVRAGVIASPNASNKASEHLPDRQGDDWLAPKKCLKKKEKILSISTSPGRNFSVDCLKCPVLICSSSRVAHRKGI